jgi:hypothetical protein
MGNKYIVSSNEIEIFSRLKTSFEGLDVGINE